MAVHHGLAAVVSRDCLCNRRFLSFRYWQHTNALGTPWQIHLTAVARVLVCVWLLVANPCDAHVYRSIRAIVRRTYDFWRGDLHGCARHASWNARGLCRACSWCWDCNHQCLGGSAAAVAFGNSRSTRGVLSSASNIRLVQQRSFLLA